MHASYINFFPKFNDYVNYIEKHSVCKAFLYFILLFQRIYKFIHSFTEKHLDKTTIYQRKEKRCNYYLHLFFIFIQAYIMKSLIKFVFNLIEKTFPLCIIFFHWLLIQSFVRFLFALLKDFSEPQWLPLRIGRLFLCRQVFNTLTF